MVEGIGRRALCRAQVILGGCSECKELSERRRNGASSCSPSRRATSENIRAPTSGAAALVFVARTAITLAALMVFRIYWLHPRWYDRCWTSDHAKGRGAQICFERIRLRALLSLARNQDFRSRHVKAHPARKNRMQTAIRVNRRAFSCSKDLGSME